MPFGTRVDMSKHERLVQVVSELARKYRDELEEMKRGVLDLARPDFLWHSFLEGMATMGNANGYPGLIGNQENYEQVRFERLAPLPPEERLQRLEHVLRKAGVRWPNSKAGYLASNVQRILDIGGPVAARDKLLDQAGRDRKIKFLSSFAGIGSKYARNVLMGAYHEEFRDCIAIDARIQKVTNALGLTFSNYQAHEDFYLGVAYEVGINGWEMDRLLYYHVDEVLEGLS
jgi:hypothetical protein